MAINATSEGKKITLHTHYENQTSNMGQHNKSINNIFEISAVHEFADCIHKPDEKEMKDWEGRSGYDWYFIKQAPLLNGQRGYDFHWAGTNQKVWTRQKDNTVKEEKWYVGQGEVALNYVSAYALKSYFSNNGELVKLYEAEPTALNETREHTVSNSASIGGAFSGGYSSEGGGIASGQASLNWGLSFESSETTTIYDCTCTSYTDGSTVSWEYRFKKPDYYFQRIKDVPELSHSTFSPVNLWVWRVPTIYREKITSFESEIVVDEASMICRYSGSQSAKVIPGSYAKKSFTVPLPVPPLLSCSEEFLSVDKNGGTKNIPVMTEYDILEFSFDDENSCDWITVKHLQAHTEKSVLEITINKMDANLNSRNCAIKITGKKQNTKNGINKTESIMIVVSQTQELIK